MKKLHLKIIYLFLLTISLIFLFVFGTILISRKVTYHNDNYLYLNGEANKVILFIGDGMGENHINIGQTYLQRKIFFTNFEKNGYVSTYSKEVFSPTDSAASGTALATGTKVNNRQIAYHNGENLESITEFAKANGYGVGIVTTDSLDGATPSTFSAHAEDRSNSDEIILSQLDSNIDLFLGAGYSTYINYKENFENSGYIFINKYSSLLQTKNKLIGTFSKINNYYLENDLPTLPVLVKFAIEYFESNFPNGYFIMIEGAHIDKMSHDNEILAMIKYLDEFDNSIKLAYDKLSQDRNVCFIVTADHETGNLQLTKNIDEINNDLYRSEGHTSKNVKYYIYHNSKKINKIQEKIDNTDIYKICKALLTKD